MNRTFAVVVMPLRTSKGSMAEDAINEQIMHVGLLPRRLPNCRDEVIAAFEELIERHGDRFTACARTGAEQGTELTVCTAMKSMNQPHQRRPDVLLERAGKSGFRLTRNCRCLEIR
jgi:hypothetical protein